MTKIELIASIGGILALISVCFGAYFWFDDRYAHASDMVKAMDAIKKVSIRLDYKIIEDQLRGVQQRIWTIEDRYCQDTTKPCDEGKMPEIAKKQYRELKLERGRLQDGLENLSKSKPNTDK